MYITIFLAVVFAVCVAFVFSEGLWGAAIMLINVMTAALLATNFFEPLATWLNGMLPSFTYLWDIVAVWAIFALSLVIMRLATDFLSRHKVRFLKPLDVGGGLFFAAWIGWVMVQFTLFTMHMAPLSRNYLGFQEKPDDKMFFGLGPDRDWLAFIHGMSKDGALGRDSDNHIFDPNADFILKYGARRDALAKEPGLLVSGK